MKNTFIKRAAAAVLAAAMTLSAGTSAVSAVQSGWVTYYGVTRYLLSDGRYATGVTIINDTAYQFDSEGNYIGLYTGFASSPSGDLYYYSDGKIYTGWLSRPSGTYYLKPDGTAAKGNLVIGNVAYMFDSKGRLMDENYQKQNTNILKMASPSTSYRANSKTPITFLVEGQVLDTDWVIAVSGLQKYKDGKWYKMTADRNIPEMTGVVSCSIPRMNLCSFSFCPDDYYDDLPSGKYRLAATAVSNKGSQNLYCDIEITNPLDISAAKTYSIADTKSISFTVTANTETVDVCTTVTSLYFKNTENGNWELVEPITNDFMPLIPKHTLLSPGTTTSAVLDLTRYNRENLKTGDYMVELSSGITYTFEMHRPFEVTVSQIPTDNKYKKKIQINLTNDSYQAYDLKGYGKLWRYENKKWKAVSLKRSKSLDTSIALPARYKWSKTMMLTDYYSSSSLKAGTYRIEIPVNKDYSVYATFKLS
ncbi:MAG: immunoglobulin-like domain-containing protein [Huintestinicola sp.]